MSTEIIKSIDAERKQLTSKLKALDKARALLAPGEEVPAIKRSSPQKRRKPGKRQSGRTIDKGLTDTVMNFLGQPEAREVAIGLTAVNIVELLKKRGFLFTSKFPSRSVSGILTVMHKQGKVSRTPKGKPRIYHYRAASGPASVPASSAPEPESRSQQRRLAHQVEGGEGDGLEARSQGPQ